MNDLTPASNENSDPLDALLREANTYTDDAGFTARVIAALPPRRASSPRLVVHAIAALTGCVLIAWQLFAGPGFAVAWPHGFSLMQWQSYAALLPFTLALLPIVAVAGSLGWIFYALANED